MRDLLDWVGGVPTAKAIAIGQDGLIGDRIVLWTGAESARVVVCINDEPGQLLQPQFELAPSFDIFMERLLGASQEGRTKLIFWMD